MSSDEITSTMEVLRALAAIELAIEARMPVTTTSSTWVASPSWAGVVLWALADPAKASIRPAPTATPVISRVRDVKRLVMVISLRGRPRF